MDLLARLGSEWAGLGTTVVAAIGVYVSVIVLTRLAGLRSLAKMSSFDFATTVAIGSTVASTALAATPLANGVVALAMLYGLQYLVATMRRKNLFRGAIDNEPLLLMAGNEVLEGNLQHARMSKQELWSQLRLNGVQRRDQVRAVILETTGDLSVIKTDEVGDIDQEFLTGVRGSEHLLGSGR